MSWYMMHRGWQDHEVFADEKYTEREAWEWLISHALFEPKTININGQPVRIERGQLSHSIRYLAEAWQWHRRKVERYLDRLQKWQMIGMEAGHGRLVITVAEYHKYQSSGTQSGTAEGQQRDTGGTNNKKDKELKKEKRGRATRLAPEWVLPESWGDWAVSEGMSIERVLKEEEKFRDYWLGVGGQKGTKIDWEATWRNWIRRAME